MESKRVFLVAHLRMEQDGLNFQPSLNSMKIE